MAITTINSLAIPAGTVVSADLTYPLTGFSSTGIDDNATSTAITIDASQNVTVGGTTAGNAGSVNVSVGSPGSTVGGVQLWAGTSGSHFMQFGDVASGDGYYRGAIGYLHSSDSLVAYSAGAERMRIDSSGRVGINTSSPDSNIISGIDNQSFVVARYDLSGGVPSGGLGGIYSANANAGGFSSGDVVIQARAGVNSRSILFYTGNTSTERMRIDSSGNVGIGTASPANKLHVKGTWTNGEGILQIDADSGTQYSGLTFQNNGTVNTYFYHDNTNSLTFLGSITGQPLVFASNTNGTSGEAMRIDSSGNLLVGKTAPGETAASGNGFSFNSASGDPYFAVVNSGTIGANAGIYINQRNRAATNYLMYFYSNDGSSNTYMGHISHNGTTAAYVSASDERLKENIVDAPAGNIDDIRVRSFDWKADGSHQTYGMVAQELVDVAPEAVSQGETEDDMWGVDYSKLVPMMIKEIQDLKAEVAALKGA